MEHSKVVTYQSFQVSADKAESQCLVHSIILTINQKTVVLSSVFSNSFKSHFLQENLGRIGRLTEKVWANFCQKNQFGQFRSYQNLRGNTGAEKFI